jgi:hypothetical protein
MKKSYTVLSVLLSLYLQSSSQTGQKAAYTLEIRKGKVINVNGKTYWEVLTTLTNASNDSLKYFSMSCSWQDFYSVDNKNLTIETSLCNKNIPVILSLPPNTCRRERLRLFTNEPKRNSNIRFKIGMNIMQASSSPFEFDPKEELKKKNVIWSNTIKM